MLLYINQDTLKIQERINLGNAIEQIEQKCGNTPPIGFVFTDNDGLPIEVDFPTALTSLKFGAKIHDDFLGDYVVSNWDGATFAYTVTGRSNFTDAATNTNTTLTSATAAFTNADVGRTVTGSGIPDDTTILSVQSATSVTLSAATTATATGVSILIGRTPTYWITPNLNSIELNDELVDGTIAATPADQTARYAMTGLTVGTIVRQVSDQTYWIVIDAGELDNADGWSSDVPQLEKVDLDAELQWIIGDVITATLTVTLRIWNEVNKGNEGVPISATPSYPLPGVIVTITGMTSLPTSDPHVNGSLWNNGGVLCISAG